MMDWNTFGIVVTVACVIALFALGVRKLLSLRLCASARDKNTWVVLLLFAAIATVEAQKPTNNVPPNLNAPLPQMQQGEGFSLTGLGGVGEISSSWRIEHSALQLQLNAPTLSPVQTTVPDADIARGYYLVEEDDSAAAILIPTNAVTVGNWHLHGARSSLGNNRLDLAPWSFPLGTNHAAFSSFWYFVEGKIRPTPRDATHEICAVGAPMLAVPGESGLWLAAGDDDSRTVIWDNFFLNGDTNAPVTAQIQLWPDATQSNNLRRVYARINPDDWDGDGLANAIDPAPTTCDGDFYGTANALPTNANPAAYYWLDVSATGALGVATIRVTCDGPSDLGDHVIVARTNEVCHVPLLAGATYDVESDLPIETSAVSSAYAEIATNDASHLTVSLPLELAFERVQMRGGPESYIAHTTPIDVLPRILGLSGGCCSCVTNEQGFAWTCADTCTCHGHEHGLEAVATWGGYSRLFGWWGYCACHYNGGGWGATNGLVGLSMTLPKVLFTNNNGGAEPEDIATLALGFTSPMPTNGTLTLDLALPNVDVNVWAYSNRVGAVSFPLTWDVEDFTGLELFVEGRAEDVMEEVNRFTFEWRDGGGNLTLGVTNRFTVYHPVANVVNGTLCDGGELCNPAAIVTGTNACFALEFPSLHPAVNAIQWSVAEGDAQFVGGDTGERVRVASDATNQVVKLRAQIGDCVSRPIEMMAYVVEPVSVRTTVWIVRDDFGGNAARSASDVTNIIAEVNKVYAQIGVSFYIDTISYVNDRKLLSLTQTSSDARDRTKLARLVNLSQNTGGVELYFVNDVGDGALGCSNDYGSAISSNGDAMTVAHELGHSFRTSTNSSCLKDVYPHGKRSASLVLSNNEISQSHLYDDWNNGTGFRYYENGKSQADVIKRLLMCGIHYSTCRDLSVGPVYGLREDCAETTVDVGFFTGNIRKLPSHR